MKALVKNRSEPGLWLVGVPDPTIGINDVLIRVDPAGICGTYLHKNKWDAWAQMAMTRWLHREFGPRPTVVTGLRDRMDREFSTILFAESENNKQ